MNNSNFGRISKNQLDLENAEKVESVQFPFALDTIQKHRELTDVA